MATSAFVRVFSITSVGVGGWLVGSCFEKFKFNRVEAALPIPSSDVAEKSSSLTGRRSEILRYGIPGMDNVRSRDDFVLSYDRRNRIAHWVLEHLTHDTLKDKTLVDRNLCKFKEDDSFPSLFRSTNEDYSKSGFDRGHLAAAGNHRVHQSDCDQTFILSNIAPQVGKGFNRGIWNKLEKYTRYLTKFYKNVYVCTGPLYLPRLESDGKLYVKYQVIGANHVAVPTHFFKVIAGETEKGQFDLEAFVLPNQAIEEEKVKLTSFHQPLESIERSAGFRIFDKIPQNKIKKINGHASKFV